jgi:molybdopterin-guanine dinucleotide biosynthesis protein A
VTPVAGAVLAGGASRRMGRTKALVPIDGVPMAARVAAALGAGGCSPVVLVGGDERELDVLGMPIVADLHPGAGPLGAIVTALRTLDDDVVVAACDLAGLDEATVRAVVDEPVDATTGVVVAVTDRLQPGLARWRRCSLAAIEAMFEAGERSLRTAVLGLDHVQVRVGEAALRNVNTPADLDRWPSTGPSSR